MRRIVLVSLVWGWSFLLVEVVTGGALVVAGNALVQGRFRRRRRLPRIPTSAALVALLVLAGCGGVPAAGGGDRTGSRCGSDTEEPLDAGSVQHLLPGAPEPVYSSDPPTSGPHAAGGAPSGAVDRPVARPAQVALLEEGGVMLQYKGVAPADVRRLRALSGRRVVVAPNPGLTSAVVATAWRHRLTCGGAGSRALHTLATFVRAHEGRGPDH